MLVNRVELLRQLQSVRPGLSPRETVIQSSSLVFRDGRLMTFSGEVACRAKSPFGKAMTGAVRGEPLIAQLEKWKDDEVDVSQQDSLLLIKGKGGRAGIRMDSEITTDIDTVETPDDSDWHALPDEFGDAVGMAAECVSTNEASQSLLCVHLHPEWVEGTDNYQLLRYRINTGLSELCLVKGTHLRAVTTLGVHEFAETPQWLHFRNPDGLVVSCLRITTEPGYDTSKMIKPRKGQSITLPKTLVDVCEKAEVFTSETPDENEVLVDIRPGRIRVKGDGGSGWYQGWRKLSYDGPPRMFMISPSLLSRIVERWPTCVIDDTRLRVDGGKFVYVSALGTPKTSEEAAREGVS